MMLDRFTRIFRQWFKTKIGHGALLSLFAAGLLTDWFLFSNCGPVYFDEPVPCDSSAWAGKVFAMPASLPGNESMPVSHYQFLALSDEGRLSGFAQVSNGPAGSLRAFTYSISGDSLQWLPRTNPFFATVGESDGTWLGCQGQKENGSGTVPLIGKLQVPPATCVPGKWAGNQDGIFAPYETLEYRDCILLGHLMDSLVWGACRPVIESSVDSLTTVIWSGTRISTEWTRLFAGRQIIDAQGPWVLTRKPGLGNGTSGYQYGLEKWEQGAPSPRTLPAWKMLTALALRQDGQVAAFATDTQGIAGRWHLLDSNQKEIALEITQQPTPSKSPFPDVHPSTGNGRQWIFASLDGLLQKVGEPGNLRTHALQIQSLQLNQLFMVKNYSLAILQGGIPTCALRTGIHVFPNPFP